MRTTLESGAWVEHVAIGELKGAHRRKLDRVVKPRIDGGAIGDDGELSVRDLVAGMDIGAWTAIRHDALWAVMITAWSYEMPPPRLEEGPDGQLIVAGAEALDEIPIDDYDAIDDLLKPHGEKLARRPDPKSSTTSGSNGSSPARAGGSRRG